ncbi:MAG: DNA polymerase III subunit delta [Syntrophobacteraceae bacterium]
MHAEDLPKTLDPAKLRPVYLFIGDSALRADEAWKRLVAATASRAAGKSGGERVQARDTSAGQVIERLSTMPMFGGKKLLMVERVDAWGKEDRGALESFLPRIPPSACLVVTAPGRKGIEGLAKAVDARGGIIEFRAPAEKDAPRWLVERAREKGKVLSFRAAYVLVEMTGADLSSLLSELEKICTFVGERTEIEAEDIEAAATSQRISSTFELLDQIRARQAGKAVKSLRSLVLSGEPPLKVLASLAWQIRMLWQVKDGLGRGVSETELAAKLKRRPFAVRKASEQAARFSESDLRAFLEAIRQADVDIKSTGSPPELVLEALLLDLCMEKKI